MAGKSVPVRLEAATLDRLAQRQRETGESRSELARRYIEEGLRMERHPGIVFRDGPAGRRAALVGGPDIWEIMPEVRDIATDDDAAIEARARALTMPAARLRAAIRYYAEYGDEIDAWIERNDTLAEQAEAAWRKTSTSTAE